jgi:alanine-glyoxylate transaminase/serine-glyoxylate transaminase/serine-pyruvate transaminase
MNYALHEALALVLEEGLERRFDRHRLHSRALVAGLGALGFGMLVPEEGLRLPMLNAVRVPEEVSSVIPEAQIRKRLLEEYGIEIGGGLGPLAGKIWRIGLMGESSRRENVLYFLASLESLLAEAGLRGEIGAGLDAAARVYREAGGSAA